MPTCRVVYLTVRNATGQSYPGVAARRRVVGWFRPRRWAAPQAGPVVQVRRPPYDVGMTGTDRRRFPLCRRVFDGLECRRRGEHTCRPRVDHALAFFRELLVHTKGDYARQAFIPAAWEETELLVPLFGTVQWEPTWERYLRRYRELYLSTGRKNGKTELIAGLMLYMLVADARRPPRSTAWPWIRTRPGSPTRPRPAW